MGKYKKVKKEIDRRLQYYDLMVKNTETGSRLKYYLLGKTSILRELKEYAEENIEEA